MPFSERRHFPRFPFHSRGALSLAGQQHLGTVLDVSLNGALFRTVDPLESIAGGRCNLEIVHSGEPGFRLATARVVYHRDNLLGLEFVELTEYARKFLGEVISMNLAVDALLERELSEMLGQASR